MPDMEVTKMESYELIRTSYPDIDELVVEIWFQNNLIAILSENNEVELFHDNVDESLFESIEFASVLDKARKKLGVTQE